MNISDKIKEAKKEAGLTKGTVTVEIWYETGTVIVKGISWLDKLAMFVNSETTVEEKYSYCIEEKATEIDLDKYVDGALRYANVKNFEMKAVDNSRFFEDSTMTQFRLENPKYVVVMTGKRDRIANILTRNSILFNEEKGYAKVKIKR